MEGMWRVNRLHAIVGKQREQVKLPLYFFKPLIL